MTEEWKLVIIWIPTLYSLFIHWYYRRKLKKAHQQYTDTLLKLGDQANDLDKVVAASLKGRKNGSKVTTSEDRRS